MAQISIFPRTGVRGLQRLPFLKIFNVLEWERRFSLEPNAAKNTCHIKKCLQQKLFGIKFHTKNSVDACFYLPQEWTYGCKTLAIFETDCNVLEWESRFLWGRTLSKVPIVLKNDPNKNCIISNFL